MRLISIPILLLGLLASLAAAATAPTFCKCTCFKQSKIIPLGPQHTDNKGSLLRRWTSPLAADDESRSGLAARSASSSCTQCTKAFCITNLGVDICKDATDEDVQTMCFQRDSNKDKIIVWGFILGTSGLLGWAAAKKIMELRGQKLRDQIPTGQRGGYNRVDGR